jgi:hypothetical protein
MNTARKIKRYQPSGAHGEIPDGGGTFGIDNTKVAAAFGSMIAQFEHLEAEMDSLLAILL